MTINVVENSGKNGITCIRNFFSKRFAHFGWYVGIKKTGRGKNGRKTWYPWGQKAIRFVARKPSPEPHPVKQLTNRHGMTLLILNDGTIKGTIFLN